jgi:hypothetical protein
MASPWLTYDSLRKDTQCRLKAITVRRSRPSQQPIARHRAVLHTRSTGLSEYVSHTFTIMSNVWQRLFGVGMALALDVGH